MIVAIIAVLLGFAAVWLWNRKNKFDIKPFDVLINIFQMLVIVYAVAFLYFDGDDPLVRIIMTVIIIVTLDFRYKLHKEK